MLRRLLVALVLCLLPALAIAQAPLTPQQRMDLFSELEDMILQERGDLLSREAAMADPIWMRVGTYGGLQLVDGTDLQARLLGLSLILEQGGLSPQLLSVLPLSDQLVYRLSGASPGLRASAVVSGMMAELRSRSVAVRADAMAGYDDFLARVRAAFSAAMADRNALGAPLPGPGLVGLWRGCDGRTIRFTGGPTGYLGHYEALGGLGAFHFTPGELGVRVQATADPAVFVGEVEWRWTDGRVEWHPARIVLGDGQITTEGADSCGRVMTRVE